MLLHHFDKRGVENREEGKRKTLAGTHARKKSETGRYYFIAYFGEPQIDQT